MADRDKALDDTTRASLEALASLSLTQRKALLLTHLSSASMDQMGRELGLKAVTAFPSGTLPQVPIDDKKWFPIYAKCVELDIPICITTGVPGPRVPMLCQKTELLDEVCWFFPELKLVTRHGCEPWEELAVKLMLKWPNLYYSTSAFAPRHCCMRPRMPAMSTAATVLVMSAIRRRTAAPRPSMRRRRSCGYRTSTPVGCYWSRSAR